MYYYGYNGGYAGGNSLGYNTYPTNYGNTGYGYGAAIILVLFILLVIIFGVGFINNGNGCGCNNGSNN